MRTGKPTAAELGSLPTIGGLLGIKTSGLLAQLAPVATACRDDLVLIIPHTFASMSATTHVPRELAETICGPWLAALPGDRLELELDATTVIARSDDAALPATTPALVRTLGEDLVTLGHDGAAWTYVIAQANANDAEVDATIARIDHVAAALGVTGAQRRIATSLHRTLARGMTTRAWVRARGAGSDLAVDPVIGLAWDRVEWQPVQSIVAGFYPAIGAIEKIARLARASEVDDVTLELVLGPTDPPAVRIAVRLEG